MKTYSAVLWLRNPITQPATLITQKVLTGMMRHVMSCIVLRFHKNKYQAATFLRVIVVSVTCDRVSHFSELAEVKTLLISQPTAERKSLWYPVTSERESAPQSGLSAAIPSRCHFFCLRGINVWTDATGSQGWRRRETNSQTVSALKACELQVNSGLIIIRQARDGLAYYQWEGQMGPNRIFSQGSAALRACFQKGSAQFLGLFAYVCGNIHR